MRNYEVAFIVHPEVNEHALTALTEKVQGWVTTGGGALVRTDHWGKRRLAYAIRKQRDGHYVFVYAAMPPVFPRNHGFLGFFPMLMMAMGGMPFDA